VAGGKSRFNVILYRIEYGHGIVRWFRTEKDLNEAIRVINKAGVKIDVAEKINVPTSKPDLLKWLNECCNQRA